MGFLNLAHKDLSKIPGYTPFMEEGFSHEALCAKPGQALDSLLDIKYLRSVALAMSAWQIRVADTNPGLQSPGLFKRNSAEISSLPKPCLMSSA